MRAGLVLGMALLAATSGCTTTTVSARSGFDVPYQQTAARGIARWRAEGDIKPAMSVAPQYNRAMIEDGEEGEVTLKVRVLSTGQVALVEVVEVTNRDLLESAQNGIRGVLFDPALAGQDFEITAVYQLLDPQS